MCMLESPQLIHSTLRKWYAHKILDNEVCKISKRPLDRFSKIRPPISSWESQHTAKLTDVLSSIADLTNAHWSEGRQSRSVNWLWVYILCKIWRRPNYINYCLKSEVSITLHCRLCSTRYTAVWIKNCLKSTSAIKISTIKNTDDFRYEGKPSRAITKSTLFAVSKDEWETKNTGKSMKNALYVLWYAKRHLSGQSNVEQWNNQACSLGRYRVMLVWRNQPVSYLLNYSVSQ